MRIAICDDEPECLSEAITVSREYAELHTDKQYIFESFSHPEDLLEAAERVGCYDAKNNVFTVFMHLKG